MDMELKDGRGEFVCVSELDNQATQLPRLLYCDRFLREGCHALHLRHIPHFELCTDTTEKHKKKVFINLRFLVKLVISSPPSL